MARKEAEDGNLKYIFGVLMANKTHLKI